ncbi:MAG: EpsI family protein [Gammaproteobacteria bacterium]|nr:EpsI family protein [Gammaproteobacteria bacterium]
MKFSIKNLAAPSVAFTVVIFLLLLTLVLYQQTVFYLNDIWSEISVGEYAHGYLVLAISVFLIYSNRNKLKNIAPCPVYAVQPLLFLSVLLWLTAVLVDVEVVQTVGLLLIIFTLVWSILGHAMMKQLAFPILFIGFAIPLWFPLSPLLQNLTADVVFWVARLIEIPAYREENIIIVPSGAFSIEEACSGLRYFLAALTLGSLYAYMNYVSPGARVAVVIVAAATALLANFIRVFIVVYLGYATEMQHPWVDDHLMLGWYLFGGLIAVLLFLDARFYKKTAVPATALKPEVIQTASDNPAHCGAGGARLFYVSALCLIILFIGPAVIYQQNSQQSSAHTINLVLPGSAMGWSEPLPDSDDWLPQYHGAIQMKSVHQVRSDDASIFVAYYPTQKQGEEVINDLNRISNKKIWKTSYSRPRVILMDKQSIDNQYVLEQLIENSQNQKRLVWYWYNIGGRVTINKYEAKVMQLTGLITGQPQAYMAAVSVAIKGDVENARKALREIVSDMQQPLAAMTVLE